MDQGITVPVKAGSSVDLQAPPKRASWDSALTLTYQDLLNKFLEGATEATQRLHIWAVRIWVDGVMALPESVVGDELLRNFEEELTFARNRLTKTRASRTAANFATTIRSFRALYLRELQGGLLPDKFSDVIQLGLKRLGKSSHPRNLPRERLSLGCRQHDPKAQWKPGRGASARGLPGAATQLACRACAPQACEGSGPLQRCSVAPVCLLRAQV